MGGPAIPIALIAAFILWFSVTAHKRGRALRTRGIRVPATCVNSKTDKNGSTWLQVQFTSDAGIRLQTSVGPFEWAPVPVGGVIEVVYDPNDTSNVVAPKDVTNGKVALASAVGSGTLLFLCLFVMVVDFTG
ncbi:DUF3592 domain-containing protein [Streptomyces pseudovenezuelae]|uniref:DUF3592 domain-containing protein n=1 Tax=Streptomyces pseudovenezuelae TaxID=67350 RepID=A0ABT6LGF0_9ACTN|nr:hypothetical protein [Streptomyces pseudovenezuelae]